MVATRKTDAAGLWLRLPNYVPWSYVVIWVPLRFLAAQDFFTPVDGDSAAETEIPIELSISTPHCATVGTFDALAERSKRDDLTATPDAAFMASTHMSVT